MTARIKLTVLVSIIVIGATAQKKITFSLLNGTIAQKTYFTNYTAIAIVDHELILDVNTGKFWGVHGNLELNNKFSISLGFQKTRRSYDFHLIGDTLRARTNIGYQTYEFPFLVTRKHNLTEEKNVSINASLGASADIAQRSLFQGSIYTLNSVAKPVIEYFAEFKPTGVVISAIADLNIEIDFDQRGALSFGVLLHQQLRDDAKLSLDYHVNNADHTQSRTGRYAYGSIYWKYKLPMYLLCGKKKEGKRNPIEIPAF